MESLNLVKDVGKLVEGFCKACKHTCSLVLHEVEKDNGRSIRPISPSDKCLFSSSVISVTAFLSGTMTRHFPHVPFPPHSDLMVTPALCAASSRLIPGLTFVLRLVGSNGTVMGVFIGVSSQCLALWLDSFCEKRGTFYSKLL